MRKKDGFPRRALDYSLAVHNLVDKVPGAEENEDLVAIQLVKSAMMIGPKYGGIVRGLDRGHVLERLTLACGYADESLYWLEYSTTYWPQLAEEARWLIREGKDIAAYAHEKMDQFLEGIDEVDGQKLPWAPMDWDSDDDLDDEDWD